MEAKTPGQIQCNKCNAVYAPVIKVLERVCPQCLSMKTRWVTISASAAAYPQSR